MATQIKLSAHAKINLSLDVLGRRQDGFHQVEMVIQTIDLADTITLQPSPDNAIAVKCPYPFIPQGPGNLAWDAANLIRDYSGCKGGVTITVDKKIPVAAGLGGGSADAAAVLKGLNTLWDLKLSSRELADLGSRLGADVPFCLLGGTALAEGVGEILTPLPAPPKLWVVLAKPNIGVSTAEVYRCYQNALVRKRPDTCKLIRGIRQGNTTMMAEAMANVLESVTFEKLPLLKRLKHRAMELGALVAMMSGSGPTIYALVPDYKRALTVYNGIKHLVEFAHITAFKGGI